MAGETAGFAVVVAVMAATQDLSPAPHYALAVAAGGIEGALLGAGQAHAMSGLRLPRRVLRRWPVVTSAAAMLAWAIGMLPSSIAGIAWGSAMAWAAAVVGGAVLLLSIPSAQYLLLRSAVPGASSWIGFNVLAWLVGIGWTFAPSPLVDQSTKTAALIAAYGVAGLLMATTVAIITGLCWVGWLRRGVVRPAPSDPDPAPGRSMPGAVGKV